MTYSIYCVALKTYDDDEGAEQQSIAAIDGCDTRASLEAMSHIKKYLPSTCASAFYLTRVISPLVKGVDPLVDIILDYYENAQSTCVVDLWKHSSLDCDLVLEHNLNDDNEMVLNCSELDNVSECRTGDNKDMDAYDQFMHNLCEWKQQHVCSAASEACWLKIFLC